MSFMTSNLAIGLRSALRRSGALPLAARLIRRKHYEQAFDQALMESIHVGDRVWDVGANVGYYAVKFAAKTGPSGAVVAFEPSPATLVRLRHQVAGHDNIRVVAKALGARDEQRAFVHVDEADGVASSIAVPGRAAAEATLQVTVTAADSLIGAREPVPQVVKIDVEGFELDVVEGMATMLTSRDVRAVGIEVHFAQLAERGLSEAPRTIEQRLRAAGFTVRWVDSSHLLATRRS